MFNSSFNECIYLKTSCCQVEDSWQLTAEVGAINASILAQNVNNHLMANNENLIKTAKLPRTSAGLLVSQTLYTTLTH